MWRNDKMIWSHNPPWDNRLYRLRQDTNLCFCLFWRSVSWSSNAINACTERTIVTAFVRRETQLGLEKAAPRVQWLLTCALSYPPPGLRVWIQRGQEADRLPTRQLLLLYSPLGPVHLFLWVKSEEWAQYCQKEKETRNCFCTHNVCLSTESDKCIVQPN